MQFSQDLTSYLNFCTWLYGDKRANGKPSKIPFSVKNGKALNGHVSLTDLSSFQDAIQAAQARKHTGIGLHLGDGITRKSDGALLFALDFDDLPENPQAAAWYERLKQLTYTENTPSGDGGRAFLWGNAGHMRKNARALGIEIYTHGGFVTVTGKATGQPTVTHLDTELSELLTLLNSHTETTPKTQPETPQGGGAGLSDSEVLTVAFRAKNGEETRRIFEGGLPNTEDQTTTGVLMSVTGRISPYCLSPEQVCRVARASLHYCDRWDEVAKNGKTQLEYAAEKAFKNRQFAYTKPQNKNTDAAPLTTSKAITTPKQAKPDAFWFETGKTPELKIDRLKFIQFLESQGFSRVWVDEKISGLVQIKDNIAQEKTPEQIRDYVFSCVRSLPHQITPSFTRDNLEALLIKGHSIYFSEPHLKHVSACNKPFHTDRHTASFVYYKNGFVEVTQHGANLKPYGALEGIIWKSQILERNYKKSSKPSMFAQFQKNICTPAELRGGAPTPEQQEQTKKRMLSLQSAMGYMMHRYATPVNIRAVVFCDEKITLDLQRGGHGGSGKGLSMEGVRRIRNVQYLDGKTFDFKDRFKFQDIGLETDIAFFDDIHKRFDIENLYSVLSNGYTKEAKGKDRIKLPQAIKTALSTNHVLTGDTPSDRRRKFEIEISDYYSDTYTPIQDFGGDLFGESWDSEQWAAFDNYMLSCLQLFLARGLIASEHVNLKLRRLIAASCSEFVEFAAEIATNEELEKKTVYQQFIDEYPDFNKIRQRTFTGWLREYAKFKGYIELSKDNGTERRANGGDYFIFKTAQTVKPVTANSKLPQHAYKDDIKWIQEQLEQLPSDMRAYAISQYDKIYTEIWNAETDLNRKDNSARAAANDDLRVWVEDYNTK
jgi:hypothetical protein